MAEMYIASSALCGKSWVEAVSKGSVVHSHLDEIIALSPTNYGESFSWGDDDR